MVKIIREGSKTEPKITVDRESSEIVISGESAVSNAIEYYSPVVEIIASLTKNTNKVCIHFAMDYYNTATTKMLIELFALLEEIYSGGADVCVVWESKESYPEEVYDLLKGYYIPFQIL